MKCSSAHCNREAPGPTFEVPAPFCAKCRENPGSGRRPRHWKEWELTEETADALFAPMLEVDSDVG